MNKFFLFGALLAMALAGCGDKNKRGAVTTGELREALAQRTPAPTTTLPSIAGRVNEYHVFDFGKDINFEGFMRFRDEFMRMAAADPTLDEKKFGELAIVEIGAETDGFKREDLVKKNADRIAEMKKNAISKAFIGDSRPERMTATISAYDMDKESYVVTLRVSSFRIGYAWDENSAHYNYRLVLQTPSFSNRRPCFDCAGDVSIVVKAPKEQAQKIEESLAPFRDASSHTANIPAGYYVSVDRMEESPVWSSAGVKVNLDAVALRTPRQPVGSTLILIDGPELVPKN